MDEANTESPADTAAEDASSAPTEVVPETPAEPEADAAAEERPERQRRGWILPVSLVPLVLLVVLIIGWAVDTNGGSVARNVRLAGDDVSKLSETELTEQVRTLAEAYAATPVELVVTPGTDDDGTDSDEPDLYRTTAAEIGLMIDQDRTVADALEVGDDSLFLLRPFTWVGSFLSERDAPVSFRVSPDQVTETVIALEGLDRTEPVEPTVELVEGAFRVVPGSDGRGVDPDDVAAALPTAADERGFGDGAVRIEVARGTVRPLGTDADAEQAAAGLDSLVQEPVEITTSDGDRTISSDELRQWVTLITSPDGTVGAGLDPERVGDGLQDAFSDIAGGPVDAHFTIEDGKPVIIPEQAGRVCSDPTAAAKIMGALRAGSHSVALELVDGLPTLTAEEISKLGVVEEVGSPGEFGPTTEHKCCESRVQNIHRIADLIRGVLILPGDTFSVNDHVGRRTRRGGFTEGGAIIDGTVGTSVGGGISQFATTFFNASLYAGLDFGEYQSHSLYISRYPRGREATLSFPHPDLQIKNTTPYGVLVWPTYNDTSITVHLYSTKYSTVSLGTPYSVPAGRCTKVITPRQRTYPDGRVVNDTVFARYRPAEGVNC